MTKSLLSRTRVSLSALALAVVFAAGAAHSMVGNDGGLSDNVLSATEAQRLFADAPDGVDPITTGPVSVSFRKTQHDAGCLEAKWPNIPAACYPQ